MHVKNPPYHSFLSPTHAQKPLVQPKSTHTCAKNYHQPVPITPQQPPPTTSRQPLSPPTRWRPHMRRTPFPSPHLRSKHLRKYYNAHAHKYARTRVSHLLKRAIVIDLYFTAAINNEKLGTAMVANLKCYPTGVNDWELIVIIVMCHHALVTHDRTQNFINIMMQKIEQFNIIEQ